MVAIVTEARRQGKVAASGELQAWQVCSEAATNQNCGRTIPPAQATLCWDTGFFLRLRDPPGPFPLPLSWEGGPSPGLAELPSVALGLSHAD